VTPHRAAVTNATEPATMVPPSGKNPSETGTPRDILMEDDDKTIVTEMPRTTTDFLEAEMMDLNIRYKIPHKKGHSSPDNFKDHVNFLLLLTKAFDKSTFRIYDNKNQQVKSFSEPKWLNKEYYEAHFCIHDTASQRKTVIVHRVMTKQSISSFKHDPSFLATWCV
jgi:hypothetical protein